MANPAKYPMAENHETYQWAAAIEQHLNQFFSGQLHPHVKSQVGRGLASDICEWQIFLGKIFWGRYFGEDI
jgi:hypothetical protein